MPARSRDRSAASLTEVLVVISVIGVLVSLLLPAVQEVRRAAARTDCQNRIRQIGLALHSYHDANGRLPGEVDVYADPSIYNKPGTGQDLCWPAKLLPYVEQQALWGLTQDALRRTADPFQDPPHVGLGTAVRVYACPADPRLPGPVLGPGPRRYGVTSYFGVHGTGDGVYLGRPPPRNPDTRGMFSGIGGVRFSQATDGLSNTLLLGERPPDPDFASGWWYIPNGRTALPAKPLLAVTEGVAAGSDCLPNGYEQSLLYGDWAGVFVYGPGRLDNRCDAFHFWSPHGGGANWAFADGSARFLPYSARPVLKALATRAGGEVVSIPD